MRRCVPLCLALLVLGCQSSEDRACENTVRINEAAAAAAGTSDGKSTRERERACIESMVRLRYELQPDEEQWFAYMRCLQQATSMADQPVCLAPMLEPAVAPGPAPGPVVAPGPAAGRAPQ